MRRLITTTLTLFIVALLAPRAAGPAAAQPAPRVIAAYGDSGVSATAAGVAALALDQGSDGYIGLGDYGYSAGPTAWKQQMAALLAGGCYCVRGNHDSHSGYTTLYPGGSSTWSVALVGVRLIGVDSERSLWPGSSQWQWLDATLAAAQEPLKAVVVHRHWWLGSAASHPGSEFPSDPAAMEQLLARHGVTLVLASHEHNYQRSVRGGITYVVAGTGGRGTDPIRGAAPGTVRTHAGRGALMLTLSATAVTARFVAYPSAALIDSFTVLPASPATDYPIYVDALMSGWRNWSWGATVNLAATSPVYAGTRSIAFTATSAWAGLYLRATTPAPAGAYTHLRFAARATVSDQRYAVELRDENGVRIATASLSAFGGFPAAGAWTEYSIPLAALGATGRRIGGLVIQEREGQAQPALYVDSIALTAGVTAAASNTTRGGPPRQDWPLTALVAQPRTRASRQNSS